jgi:hypothetical protein
MSEPKCLCYEFTVGNLVTAYCKIPGHDKPYNGPKPFQPQQDPSEVAREIVNKYLKYPHALEAEIAQAILAERQASAAELADLRQVAQGLRDRMLVLEAEIAGFGSEVIDLEAKHDYTIGEWKKEEVLWKEREADLLAQITKLEADSKKVRDYDEKLIDKIAAERNKLEEEVSFLTEVRSNQAHLIKCLQSEVANLKGDQK